MLHALALVLLALLPALSRASARCTQNPYQVHFRLGNASALVTSDGIIIVPPPYFSVPDSAVASAYERVFRPVDPIIWQQNIPVVDTYAARVLVDAGSFGSGLPPFREAGLLRHNLRAAGVPPESIDAVLVTHGHPDHVAGLRDGEGAMAFPNAVVYVGRKEHRFWTADPLVNPSPTLPNETLAVISEVYKRSIAPYERAGRLKLVANREMPLPGVQFLLFPGHTPGHTVIEITSGEEKAVFVGDSWFSQPDQVRNPEWSRSIETDPLDAYNSRVRLLKKLARQKTLALAFHEDFPGLGRIVNTAQGFDWVPMRTQNLGTVRQQC